MMMLDILSGYGPSPAADKVSVSAVLALGFVRQFGIVSLFFPLIQHLADRRLWWSGNGQAWQFLNGFDPDPPSNHIGGWPN